MVVQWQGNSRLSDSSCHPLGVITAGQARCSSTTLSAFGQFRTMIQPIRQRSVRISRLHQLSTQSKDNSGITDYSIWMRTQHLKESRRRYQTSFSQHMSFSKPTVEP
eukprot:3228080-Amphidinium_carterae.1